MVYSVLIVDDSASIRRVLREVFDRQADFYVCGDAENGKEAIRKAQKLQPDLVVLDLFMPVMNGPEAAHILRQVMPSVVLIVYSLYVDPSSEEVSRSAGISAVVSKSENVRVLLDKARSLVRRVAA